MTIDINKLRRLAQAATPGPWYATGKLTRYVEARIDGGLIQEVAACGPTKADGGYGPQQEANARLIAAANPATISELLDRLEAAEKERAALRAKITEMEKQGPIAAQHRFRHPQKNMPDWTDWWRCEVSKRPAWEVDSQGYEVEYRQLYALPGAKGEMK